MALLPIANPTQSQTVHLCRTSVCQIADSALLSTLPIEASDEFFSGSPLTVYGISKTTSHDTTTEKCAVSSQLFWLRPIRMRLPRYTRVRLVDHSCLQPSTDTSKLCTTSSTVDKMLAVSPPALAAARSCSAKAMDSQPRSSTTASA